MTDKAIKCPYTDRAIEEVFGEEVSFFMHCHMRGYDKTGTGEQLWSDYYDKYGAPVDLLDSWLEGYHVIEKLLVKFLELCDNQIMDFPAVAGVAGGVHLYESLHSENPWQWTGWVPLQRKWLAEGKFFSNRYFISIRGNEIQNNLWNYHPHELEDADETSGFQPVDTYRGGFFFKDNPFGRYLHVMTIKEHSTVSYLQKPRRYNYIVHPLAYRKALNEIPDNGVDAMQWCIININNEKNFSEYTSPYGKCQALEIFNDFTFSASYQPESSDTCYNGTLIPGKYIYWFDTYPLEYAEFMLDSALTRGVYLHTLTSNDVFFKKVEEFDPDNDVHSEGLNWADSGFIDRAVQVAGAWLSQWRGKEYERIQIPELKHRVFGTTSSKKHRNKLIQGKELAPVSYESKDLDFRFPKCANDNEDICVYFLQACPLQQDTGIPKKTSQSSIHRPPRIQQSVHGLYLMHPDYETRLKLSNSWDKNTVKDNIVYFYDISAATGQPYILPVAHALID